MNVAGGSVLDLDRERLVGLVPIERLLAAPASVALALGVSCSIATLVAMALPYALARLGHDPAYGSGPLATVIQDLLSVIVYSAVATALV